MSATGGVPVGRRDDRTGEVTLSTEDVGIVERWLSARRHIELTLYGAVTQLAAVTALKAEGTVTTRGGLLLTVWAVAIGLAVAHWFAVAIAGRITSHERQAAGYYWRSLAESWPLLASAAIASVGAVLWTIGDPDDAARAAQGADVALIALCAAIAWAGTSAQDQPYGKRVTLTAFVVLFATFVAGIKIVLG